ncbi:MAG TPA: hypothetical protein VJT31_27305 [Rugosimonospora sp.]|nr:hypothetical protein [Rugosimonospora sp.]
MCTGLTEDQVRLVLAMVDASAAVLAPDERDEDFDEYADVVRRTGRVPGFDPKGSDGSAAGMFDASLFLGVGLAFLGQIAMLTLAKVTDMAIEKGLSSAGELVRRVWRARGPGAEPDSVDGLVAELTRRTVAAVGSVEEVPAGQVEVIVTLQVRALVGRDAR